MNDSRFTKRQIDFIKIMGDPYAKLSYTNDISAYIKKLENPYANLTEFYNPRDSENTIVIQKLNKKSFQTGCNDIFMQYIPAAAKRKMKQEHADFICRNQDRSPEERYLLLNELKKYDLTKTIEYCGHFNREKIELTERKLRAIEKKIIK